MPQASGVTQISVHRLLPSAPVWLALAACLAAANLHGATPAADSQFNVELVVFRYNGTIASPERWDTATVQADSLTGTTGTNSAAPAVNPAADVIRPLNPAQFQLAGTESALRRNSSYELLAHFGVRVLPGELDAGTAVHIEPLVDAASGLTGTVTLERGRFLHLALDVNYTTANPPAKLLAPGAQPGPLTFRLHQDRRMKPFERHYFDHPAFGVVAIVTPVGGGD
jgi:hypothetical protein